MGINRRSFLAAGAATAGCALLAQPAMASVPFAAKQGPGVYRYPLDAATAIAVREVRAATAAHPLPERVIFACFDDAALAAYRRALDAPV